MKNLVELTELGTAGTKLLVNIDNVILIRNVQKGSIILFNFGSPFTAQVAETKEEILNLMGK